MNRNNDVIAEAISWLRVVSTRADTNALIVHPAIFVQRAIYRWLNPPRLTCSRLVCQPPPIALRYCMHVLDEAARAHVLQNVLGHEVFDTWKLISRD